MGPPNVPKDITNKLANAIEKAANDPDYQKFVAERYATPFYLSSYKVVSYLDERREEYRKVMKGAGILKEK